VLQGDVRLIRREVLKALVDFLRGRGREDEAEELEAELASYTLEPV
jgi:hypothetical protein